MSNFNPLDPTTQSQKTLTIIIYALYAASMLLGITAIVAIIINYLKRESVRGTIYESHFTWQIRTFWLGLLWSVIGMITSVIFIGWLVLLATTVWFIYRLVKGFLRLNDNEPILEPTKLF